MPGKDHSTTFFLKIVTYPFLNSLSCGLEIATSSLKFLLIMGL